jgi:hypothetical protein
LDEIKARRAAATPEPWDASASGATMNDLAAYRFGPRSSPPVFLASQMRRADAEFIAHSPDDIDWLLGEVARLRCEWSSSLTREKHWRTDVKAIRAERDAALAEADDLRRELLAETYRPEGGEVVMRELIAAKAERDRLAAQVRAVEALARDLAEHGLRADLTPTVMFGDESHVYRQLTDYLRRMDSNVRERARAALASAVTPEPEGEQQ